MKTLAFTALIAALASAPVRADPLSDAAQIRDAATAIDMAVDAKDWAEARRHFTADVAVDFTSLVGGAPTTVPADALIGGWSANLGPAKTSYHQRGHGVLALEGDRATLVSNGYAWNRMAGNGDPLWEVWGTYTHDFVRTEAGWKVQGMALQVTHQRGNFWVRDTPAPAP